MELTVVANWLNTFFAGFDHFILNGLHSFAYLTSGHLNWFFRLISLFADKGIFLYLTLVSTIPSKTSPCFSKFK